MITVEEYLKHKQPNVVGKLEDDTLTKVILWIEDNMQPLVDYLL